MEGKFTRRLAAIMFTDIVGYTHLMHINEEHALRLRTRHREVLQALHDKYGGEVLQFFGDGTLSIFSSSVKAVECAVEMQLEFRKDPEVPVRIGIHVGDISFDGQDAFGDGLNVAARIEPLCEPGGVYISARVYEDIRNHAWLKAQHVGNFQLKNIEGETPLFAIASKGMSLPELNRIPMPPKAQPVNRTAGYSPATTTGSDAEMMPLMPGEGKSKAVAAILAFFLGMFGVHRFYLGRRFLGVLNFVGFFLALLVTIEGRMPWFLVALAILSLADGILLAVMPQSEFDAKFNQNRQTSGHKFRKTKMPGHEHIQHAGNGRHAHKVRPAKEDAQRNQRGQYKVKEAFLAFRAGEFQDAQRLFEESLQYDYNDPQTHFMLACCFSLAKDARQAYFHLASAVGFGLQEVEEIFQHEALQWLRSQPDFETFVRNGYQQVELLEAPKENLLDSKSYYDTTILDRIADLGELLERGVISRDDFEQQKRTLLGHD